jgi:ArsR family transcriptional regulator, arsenate/arsenite/antimonite-responsive transcriptional repressor
MKASAAVTRLAALAQESRLAVFRLLVQAGPEGLCVGDIGAKLKVAPATLSFHLKELANAGLIRARQESRFIYYSPDFKAMNDLLSYLTDNCCGGQSCEVDSTACASESREQHA